MIYICGHLQIVQEKDGEIDDSLIGGNASAEAPEEAAAEAGTTSGLDVVIRGRLVETGFGKKKDYQVHIKVGLLGEGEALVGGSVSQAWLASLCMPIFTTSSCCRHI